MTKIKWIVFLWVFGWPFFIYAQMEVRDAGLVELPEFAVVGNRVANLEPAGTYPQLVSQMRFEPQVDLQVRNFGEAQGDAAIRGGIFENTGFRVGAATLHDPQTGHYFAEIPISPAMTGRPEVFTGIDNALSGFNSTVGTLDFGWLPITAGGFVRSGFGDNGLNRQQLYVAVTRGRTGSDRGLGLDVDLARSEGDGTLSGGDHRFNRFAGRVQLRSDWGQTDIFMGYQSKFFGWPNLYVLKELHDIVGSEGLESENVKTRLFLLNHRMELGDNDFLEVSAYYRRHTDDYEFDRSRPGLFNPFEHETDVYSIAIQGSYSFEGFKLNYAGQALADEIVSTALTSGNFQSRSYYKLTLLPEKSMTLANGDILTMRGGASLDETNRDSSALSPMLSLSLEQKRGGDGKQRLYVQYARTTQVSGYTAIASNPNGGLFRGNQNLAREKSDNFEAGTVFERGNWRLSLAGFFRRDRDLVDWTFAKGVLFARAANNVDIDTYGLEALYFLRTGALHLILGYTFLTKSEDYGQAQVDASFYALNFPRHRLTAAIIYRPVEGIEIRADNEIRDQEPNPLRQGSDGAVISSLGISWEPSKLGVKFEAAVDNVFDSGFQEIPGVPGSGRQISVSASFAW